LIAAIAIAIVGWLLVVILVITAPKPPPPPKLYQHFKGAVYEFDGFARDADNPQHEVVVYIHHRTGQRWFRNRSEFFDEVVREGYSGPRFQKLGG